MSWIFAFAMFCALTAGAWLMLSRDMLRCMLGLMVLGNAVNLLLLGVGRSGPSLPAVVAAGEQTLAAQAANPLPQALVLTAIVIGFALACYSMVLLVGLVRAGADDDLAALRDAEPLADDPVKPPWAADEQPR